MWASTKISKESFGGQCVEESMPLLETSETWKSDAGIPHSSNSLVPPLPSKAVDKE